MKILVFGNPLVDKDSLSLKLMPLLQKEFPEIEFKEFDTAESLEKEGKKIIILDIVEGIKKVSLMTNLENIQSDKIYSMHDFDLCITRKLLKKMKMVETVKILGIPVDYSEKKAFEELKKLIRATLL